MTINLGDVDVVTTHYLPGGCDPAAPVLKPLCIHGGERFTPRSLNLFTEIPERVTCPGCLEWMHA